MSEPIEFSEEELEFLKGFFGTGTFAEDAEDDVIFQNIQSKLGNKPTDMRDGLFEWTVVLRADQVDTIEEMERILSGAIAEYCSDIVELMEVHPGNMIASDYELDKRDEES